MPFFPFSFKKKKVKLSPVAQTPRTVIPKPEIITYPSFPSDTASTCSDSTFDDGETDIPTPIAAGSEIREIETQTISPDSVDRTLKARSSSGSSINSIGEAGPSGVNDEFNFAKPAIPPQRTIRGGPSRPGRVSVGTTAATTKKQPKRVWFHDDMSTTTSSSAYSSTWEREVIKENYPPYWSSGRGIPRTNPYCTLSKKACAKWGQHMARTIQQGVATDPVRPFCPDAFNRPTDHIYDCETPRCRFSPVEDNPFTYEYPKSRTPYLYGAPVDSSSESSAFSTNSSIYCTMTRKTAKQWSDAVHSAVAQNRFRARAQDARESSSDDSSQDDYNDMLKQCASHQNSKHGINRMLRSLKSLRIGGQLYLSVVISSGMLTIVVDEARNLYIPNGPSIFNSYVKMFLVPDGSSRTCCKTNLIVESCRPVFNQKFTMELLPEDYEKKLFVSMWHKDVQTSKIALLGCMTFSVKTLVKENKQIEGWYFLLSQHIGRKKHMRVDRVNFLTYYGSVDSGLNNDLHQPETPTVWL